MTNSGPEEVARWYTTPLQGYVPPLPDQFPHFTLDEFRGGLELLRTEYSEARAEWEAEHGMLYAEFKYNRRIHSIEERSQAFDIRRHLMANAVESAASDRGIELSSEELDQQIPDESLGLELAMINIWQIQNIVEACAEHGIPVYTLEKGSEGEEVGRVGADPLAALPESLRPLAQRARERYWSSAEELQQRIAAEPKTIEVDSLLERCESLEYQCALFQARTQASGD